MGAPKSSKAHLSLIDALARLRDLLRLFLRCFVNLRNNTDVSVFLTRCAPVFVDEVQDYGQYAQADVLVINEQLCTHDERMQDRIRNRCAAHGWFLFAGGHTVCHSALC